MHLRICSGANWPRCVFCSCAPGAIYHAGIGAIPCYYLFKVADLASFATGAQHFVGELDRGFNDIACRYFINNAHLQCGGRENGIT